MITIILSKSAAGSTVFALRKAADKFAKDCRHMLKYGWSTLPGIFRELGLRGVETDIVSVDRIVETREAWTRSGMVGTFGWLRLVVSGAGSEEVSSLKKVEQLDMEVANDIESGGYSRFEIYVTWGPKV